MSNKSDIVALQELARHAREVANLVGDKEAAAGLLRYAAEHEAKAAALEIEAEATLPAAAAIASGEPPIARAGAALKPKTPPQTEPPDDGS